MPSATHEEAADILGVEGDTIYALASAGILTRQRARYARGQVYDLDELEARSLAAIRFHDAGHTYWLNRAEVAYYLGVTVSRVR